MKVRKKYFTLAIFIMVMFFYRTLEARFQLVTSLNLTEEYNDNIFDSSKDEVDSFISTISPTLGMGFTDGRSIISAEYHLYYKRYENNEARDIKAKYSHSGDIEMDLALSNRLSLLITSQQRYSDDAQLVDINRELDLEDLVFTSENSSTLEYDYGSNSKFGAIYKYDFFKYYGNEIIAKERNFNQTAGGFVNHAINSRNTIDLNYEYSFGKYYIWNINQDLQNSLSSQNTYDYIYQSKYGDERYYGERRGHTGDVSYLHKFNNVLSSTLSYLVDYLEYPDPFENSVEDQRKHLKQEVRNTIGYDITEILKSSYWVGYDFNNIKTKDVEDSYSNYSAGLNLAMTWTKFKLDALSGYELNENYLYTINERRGEYKSIFGGLSATIGSIDDSIFLNIYTNGRKNRYMNTKSLDGELRRENIYYFGGELNYSPLDWLDFIGGYIHVFKDTNDKNEDLYSYSYITNSCYLTIRITFPSRRILPQYRLTIDKDTGNSTDRMR
jgi:hypothetical protein